MAHDVEVSLQFAAQSSVLHPLFRFLVKCAPSIALHGKVCAAHHATSQGWLQQMEQQVPSAPHVRAPAYTLHMSILFHLVKVLSLLDIVHLRRHNFCSRCMHRM